MDIHSEKWLLAPVNLSQTTWKEDTGWTESSSTAAVLTSGRMSSRRTIGKMKWLGVRFFKVVFVFLIGASLLHAQPVPKKITAGITTLSGSTAVIYVTQKAGLKGSSVGIAGLGGASEFAANYIFRKEGMVPGKDVVLGRHTLAWQDDRKGKERA